MSYLLYLNDQLSDLNDSKDIAQTKQVNDLARLDNRQSNFTQNISLPFTANNRRIFEKIGLVGNNSNIPYSKITCDLVDADTGLHLIYKGWCVLNSTSKKGYEVSLYDGIIDFYRRIENKTLTETNVSELNHIKNVTNVVDSFDNLLPYAYLIGDYNGKNTFDGGLNIDFQIPSVKISYLFEKIIAFVGYTFEGSIFANERYTNLYMTFSKPVPTAAPVVNLVTSQTSVINQNVQQQPTPNNGLEYVTFYNPVLLPNTFTSPYVTYSFGALTVLITGVYRVSAAGSFSNNQGETSTIFYEVLSPTNVLLSSGSFDSAVQSQNINANAGEKIRLFVSVNGFVGGGIFNPLTGAIVTTVDYILGFEANFEEILLNFKCTDFINEIMQRFGLTMYKDKFENHLIFKNLSEVLQDITPLDWSDKFISKDGEGYKIGNYAKKNNFSYRYNGENEDHNDGSISINNENLKDEFPVIKSKIYSPERSSTELGKVFKFWEKAVKDDLTIDYKELTNRFYFLRKKEVTGSLTLKSEALNTTATVSSYLATDYYRLDFPSILIDFYSSIETIFNKAKKLPVSLFLKPKDIYNFSFQKLIYIDKLGSYYLVNKINNFIKGKPTSCELIEVDYNRELVISIPDLPTYLFIESINVVDCQVTIVFSSDGTFPFDLTVIGQPTFNDPFSPSPDYFYYSQTITVTSNTIVLDVIAGNFWSFYLIATTNTGFATSNVVTFNNLATCIYTPPLADLTYILITNITTYQVIGNTRYVRIDFLSDVVLPSEINVRLGGYFGIPFINFVYSGSDSFILTTVDNQLFGNNLVYGVELNRRGIISNIEFSN
jgi:hypothetical protein